MPWKNKSDEETFHRFYHVFEEGELESLMYEALGKDKMEIESLFYDQGNWCVIFTKKQFWLFCGTQTKLSDFLNAKI